MQAGCVLGVGRLMEGGGEHIVLARRGRNWREVKQVEREVEGLGYSAPIPLESVTSLGTQMHKGNNPVSLTA